MSTKIIDSDKKPKQIDTMNLFSQMRDLIDSDKWVMFSSATIVALEDKQVDENVYAISLLNKYGPVLAGTPSGDFFPAEAIDGRREWWLVSYPHCDQIFNLVYIPGGLLDDDKNEDFSAGIALKGRANRVDDANNPIITYKSRACDRDEVEIKNCDYWFKVVDMRQRHWVLIERIASGVKVYFINDASEVLDDLDFASAEEAEAFLLKNGFKRYSGYPEAGDMVPPPKPPYINANIPHAIYLSGRFWEG